jgi:integrase
MQTHDLMGGKLHVYKRENSRHWQCSTYLNGRNRRVSTKEESLEHAKDFAEDWYLELRGKARAGLLKTEKTFRIAAVQFLKEYEMITENQRSPRWVEGHGIRLRLHLVPFFGNLGLSEVMPGKVQEYRMHRIGTSRTGRPPARSTIHDEIVTLRLVLKTAIRHGWLSHLPDLSPPYKTQGKVVHRPWFSPAEYKQLYEATREYAQKSARSHYRWNAEQVHDYVLIMANTGLRPDEAKNLQHRDVAIVNDEATGERILEIEVRGKRGIGFCKSMPNAVRPYQRLLQRAKPERSSRLRASEGSNPAGNEQKFPQRTDHVFPGNHIKLFNGVLARASLKLDRDGNRRTAYSLRHTYICMRLMEGADIYQIAKNCRTSVEMIERFYAAHIKTTLDAAAINVLKPRSPSRREGRGNPRAASTTKHTRKSQVQTTDASSAASREGTASPPPVGRDR